MDLQTEVRSLRAILDDLREGRIRIPRLQRPYVWTNSQVLTLLDSVRNQYPIGSLMLWQIDQDIGFKTEIGPLKIPAQPWRDGQTVAYLLDGQQRLTTLLGALFAPEGRDPASRRWQIHFDARSNTFAHSRAALAPHEIPMRVVLDSFALLKHLDKVRLELGGDEGAVRQLVEHTQGMAAAFQQYRVPTLTLKNATLAEAVKVFVRVNKQGTLLSSDDLFSALASGIGENRPFDYRLRVDEIRHNALRPLGFDEISRMTLLRCLLAALGVDIFETDLSRIALEHADELPRAIGEVEKSTARAARWLRERIGVAGPRALPYALQFVLLSEFFRQGREPSVGVAKRLEKWIWTTSFNTSFAVGKPAHFDRAVRTARELATNTDVSIPDLDLRALPFPGKFHGRSARVRGFFLALKRLHPRSMVTGEPLPWPDLLEGGLNDTTRMSDHPDLRSLADRALVGGDDLDGGPLESLERLKARDPDLWKLTLDSHAVSRPAWDALVGGDAEEFVAHRRTVLEEMEGRLFKEMGIQPPESVRADEESEDAPIEAEDIDDQGD